MMLYICLLHIKLYVVLLKMSKQRESVILFLICIIMSNLRKGEFNEVLRLCELTLLKLSNMELKLKGQFLNI